MNTQSKAEGQQRNGFEAYPSPAGDNFNFDRWAVAVRQQMLAALKKRESHRTTWE